MRVRVLAELAKALYFTDQRRRREVLLEEALAAARRVGRPAAVIAALSASRVLRWGPENSELRLACADEMVDVAEASGDVLLMLRTRLAGLPDLVEVGDRVRFDFDEVWAFDLARALAQPYYLWRVQAWEATRALAEGRWAEADELRAQAMAVWSERHPDAEGWERVHGAISLALQGRPHEGVAEVRSVAEAQPAITSLRCLIAWLAADSGDEDTARDQFETFAVDGFTSPPPDGQWLAGVTALAETCARLHDATRAGVLAELLVPFAGRLAVLDAFGGGGVFLGSVSHALGLLAATLGRYGEAERWLRSASEANARFRAAPCEARSLEALERLAPCPR